jgi:hypothetical protein
MLVSTGSHVHGGMTMSWQNRFNKHHLKNSRLGGSRVEATGREELRMQAIERRQDLLRTAACNLTNKPHQKRVLDAQVMCPRSVHRTRDQDRSTKKRAIAIANLALGGWLGACNPIRQYSPG